MKKKEFKNRMITFSITIDPDLVAKAIDVSTSGNFSKFTRDAIKEKIKKIEESKQK